MDRQIIYPGQVPLETDLLNTNRNTMTAIAKLAAAMFGTGTVVNGLAVTQTTVASMQVQVAPGEIYSLVNLDGTAYSSLALDTTHQIVKQGISLDQVTLGCAAPGTVGFSINYLIEAAYLDTDGTPVVLPYYNASNPSTAYSGPANAGTTQNTRRYGQVSLVAKAGVAAATGTQTTPSADAGYVGLYVVTVAYGQTQITAGNIAAVAGAPVLPAAGIVAGGFQGNYFNIASAGGTADAITASYTPGIGALSNGMTLYLRAALANATTTPTFTPNSGVVTAKNIVKGAGSPLAAGDIAGAGHWIELQYDLSLDKWVLLNPATGVTAGGAQYKGIQPITSSVASNALTVGLNPTTLDFRSSSLTNGVPNTRSNGSAISLVVPSGATLGTVSGQQARLVLIAIDNAGTMELAIVNIAGGNNLDETTLISTTAISAAAAANNVIYSTTARSNVPFRVVGFVDITEATAGTWATAPSTIQGYGGQALAALSSAGYGQTWQNVAGSRALSTTYYNTTGKEISVSVWAPNVSNTAHNTQGLVNGVVIASAGSSYGGTSAGVTFPVPPGSSYSVTAQDAISGWMEKR